MLQHAIGSFELEVRSGRLAPNHALDGEHVDAEPLKVRRSVFCCDLYHRDRSDHSSNFNFLHSPNLSASGASYHASAVLRLSEYAQLCHDNLRTHTGSEPRGWQEVCEVNWVHGSDAQYDNA